MHFFFREGTVMAPGQEVELAPADVIHAYRVLRLRQGDPVAVADGRGAAFQGVIASIGPSAVRVRLVEAIGAAESPLKITLLQALLKGEKMDLVVRQAVELGAMRIVPVTTERSIPRREGNRDTGRLQRWRGIARAAAAQCRRAVLPAVEPLHDFGQALVLVGRQPSLAPWEEEKEYGLKELFAQPFPEEGAVLVFIGPEGGFSRQEAKELAHAGARTMHLGPRILRAETAAAVTLALVQSAWGDLGAGGARGTR